MKGLEKVLKYAAICLICLMCLIPFYVLLVLALNSPQRVFYEGNIFIPDDICHMAHIPAAEVLPQFR